MDGSIVAVFSAYDILDRAVTWGGIGGLVSVANKFGVRERDLMFDGFPAHFKPIFFYGIASIVAGAGAAVGFLFVLIFFKLDPKPLELGGEAFLSSASLIAGISAYRILPRFTQALEERLDALGKASAKAQAVAQEARGAARQAQDVAQEATLLSRAVTVLGSKNPAGNEVYQIMEEIEAQIKISELDRKLNIILARLYKKINDFEGALRAAKLFLTKKEKLNQFDKDYADVLFNAACYSAKLWEGGGGDKYKTECLAMLRKSCEISDENRKEAEVDEDFCSLRADPEFSAIVKK